VCGIGFLIDTRIASEKNTIFCRGRAFPIGKERRPELKGKIVSATGMLSRLLVVSLFLVMSLSPRDVSGAGLKEQVFEATLSNGLKVILLENHKAPLVSFQVWYRVGSRDEAWGRTGISHLIEHLMFKGTEKLSADRFTGAIEENGGDYNAFTSQDFTAYFENIRADRIGILLELEADRMQNLLFREEGFRTERMVVMEERRLRTDDSPQAYLLEQLEATAFQAQPYHWPTVGWMEDLTRITLEDVKSYYITHYTPSNAFLVVVGDFKKEELYPGIERVFGTIPKGPMIDRLRYQDPPQTGERRIIVKKEAQLPAVIMGYHVPNLRDPDSYVLEVIETVLSGGKSSRFYERLVRKERLVISTDSQNPLASMDSDLFLISAEPLPGKERAEVEKVLDEEMERLRKEPVGEHELEKAKNQLESAFIFGQDSLFSRGMLLASYEIALDWKEVDKYVPSIRKVSAEDIQRVANRYLIPENRTVGILIPLPTKKGKPAPEGALIKEKIIRNSGENT